MTDPMGDVANNLDALSGLRAAVDAAQRAPLTPVRVYNKLMGAVRDECARLAATASGRDRLAHAATFDENLLVRLNAATTVRSWDRDAAAAALEALVLGAGGAVSRPMTMSAALAVQDDIGRKAALCLLGLDRHDDGADPRPPIATSSVSVWAISSTKLDAAERVYSLAMNGGIDHAYEVAGLDFAAAADALEATGAQEAARLIRAVLQLVNPGIAVPAEQELRGQAMLELTDHAQRALAVLGDRFLEMDDVIDRLESARDA